MDMTECIFWQKGADGRIGGKVKKEVTWKHKIKPRRRKRI